MTQQILFNGVEFSEGTIDERGYNGHEQGHFAKIGGVIVAWGTAVWWSWAPTVEGVRLSADTHEEIADFFTSLK